MNNAEKRKPLVRGDLLAWGLLYFSAFWCVNGAFTACSYQGLRDGGRTFGAVTDSFTLTMGIPFFALLAGVLIASQRSEMRSAFVWIPTGIALLATAFIVFLVYGHL